MAVYYVDVVNGDDLNDGLSEATAWATIDKAMNTVVAGDKVWVQATGNYNETATIDTAGSATAPIVFEGYSSTPGDGGLVTIDGQSTRANGVAAVPTSSVYYVFKNIRVTGCTGNGWSLDGPDNITFKRCEADNNGGAGFIGDNGFIFSRCKSNNNTGWGFDCDQDAIFDSCVAHSNVGGGIQAFSGRVASFCLAYNNTGTNISDFASGGLMEMFVVGCTIDGEGGAGTKGIHFSGASGVYPGVCNSIIYDLDTGVQAARNMGEMSLSSDNLVNSNTNNYVNWNTFSGEVTGAPQFTDEANDDYTLASGSPAKAAGHDAGEVTGAASYMDIGAIQRQEPAGGGGSGVAGVRRTTPVMPTAGWF